MKTNTKRPAQRKGGKHPQSSEWRAKPRRSRGQGPHSYSVVQAGQMIGLSRSASYRAARSGQIPTLPVNGGMIVPKRIWDEMLGLGAASKTDPKTNSVTHEKTAEIA